MAKLGPEELDRAHEELRKDARQRVAKRGVLQFRADPELILTILSMADEKVIPAGRMLRQWVEERVELEKAITQSPDLLERLSVLEETVSYLQKKVK